MFLKYFHNAFYPSVRRFASKVNPGSDISCKVLVLGGGAGGCSIAAKFTSKLGSGNVVIVEKSERHFYQPMFTLIGGGIKRLDQSSRPMSSVLPKNSLWVQDTATHVNPVTNTVTTKEGTKITYDYLIVSLGLELYYDKVKGLEEALNTPGSSVCSNYSPLYVNRTYETLKNFKAGNAVFTFPNTPIKCAGAPLKACFISEHYLRNVGTRDDARVYYKTALPVIFSSKHYAEKLLKLCESREIELGLRQELVEVDQNKREAIFKDLDRPEETIVLKYNMLHATPPMGPPTVLRSDPSLPDPAGYLKVNKETLQHETHKNIFGIGDCTNLPTSKTAAAVAAQSGVLYDNLISCMNGNEMTSKYDGYTSCPLVTGYGTCIMAEFDYSLQPLETFPIDQSREHVSMYFMKKELMPQLYWHAMLNGYWRGPGILRKILHFGFGK